jgi:hypothetical protein
VPIQKACRLAVDSDVTLRKKRTHVFPAILSPAIVESRYATPNLSDHWGAHHRIYACSPATGNGFVSVCIFENCFWRSATIKFESVRGPELLRAHKQTLRSCSEEAGLVFELAFVPAECLAAS